MTCPSERRVRYLGSWKPEPRYSPISSVPSTSRWIGRMAVAGDGASVLSSTMRPPWIGAAAPGRRAAGPGRPGVWTEGRPVRPPLLPAPPLRGLGARAEDQRSVGEAAGATGATGATSGRGSRAGRGERRVGDVASDDDGGGGDGEGVAATATATATTA